MTSLSGSDITPGADLTGPPPDAAPATTAGPPAVSPRSSEPLALDDADLAIKVENLSLWYKTTREKDPTLRRSLKGLLKRRRSSLRIDAVRDVSFQVPTGSVYGVIGANGAGKTTLMRAVAGILPPNEGRITLWGRVSILFAIGIGFNQTLTGRENVLLGGLVAGLEREQIAERFNDIVEFSELGHAIDYPVRTYSQGMKGRLGFSIISYLDPEIVLIDEALGAGDGRFKRKCFSKIEELCEHDATVVLVSHGMGVIQRFAQRCLLLDHGHAICEGPTEQTIETYLEAQGLSDEVTTLEDV